MRNGSLMSAPLTFEQKIAVQRWRDGLSQVVSACAGSGKSTTIFRGVCEVRDQQTLVLAYNRPLAEELSVKIASASLPNARCFTFHGLASFLWELAPDDATLDDVLRRVESGELSPRVDYRPLRVMIDESQDLCPIHLRLLRAALDLDDAVLFVCGDARQLLYEYAGASDEYMNSPTLIRPGEWLHTNLTVSHRLTPANASFANCLLEGKFAPLQGANKSVPNTLPSIFSCSNFEWDSIVPKLVRGIAAPYETIAVLVRSTRRTNVPLLNLANALVQAGVPVYVNGQDGISSRVSTGKVRIGTWHSSKGTERDHVIVLGVSGDADVLRPVHVACTRARKTLAVVMDLRSPRNAVPMAIQQGLAVAADVATQELVRGPPIPPARPWAPHKPFDLTELSPRSLWADLTDLIEEVDRAEAARELEAEVLVDRHGLCDDVTLSYVMGVLLYVEAHLLSKTPARLADIIARQKLGRSDRDARLKAGDRTRYMDTKTRDAAVLPTIAKNAITVAATSETATVERIDDASAAIWLAAAISVNAAEAFHHVATRMLPVDWASGYLFKGMAEMLVNCCRECLGDAWTADAVVTNGEMVCRVHARNDETALHVVYADRISSSMRMRAAVPLAIDHSLQRVVVLSLQTGERSVIRLRDRDAYLRLAQETS